MKKYILLAIVSSGFIVACKPTAQMTSSKKTETRMMDTVSVVAARKPSAEAKERVRENYRASVTRINDLLHTKLDVRFDWAKKHLNGKAWLTLRPVFYATDSLELDAKGFDLHKVSMMEGGQTKTLVHRYNGNKIQINLGKTYQKSESYVIYIEYTAKPEELPNPKGSAAITQAKGLYFINADKSDPKKPQQIWTQGETESSSCWFPTIDKPNERCTQEMLITVDNKFKTLSNGLLKGQANNPDGSRTDNWVMDKPHAPYLFMMAVGEFAVVKDSWEGIPVEYWVEPSHEKYAKQIYNHSPEMLTYFSKLLGVKYPWPKLAHVIVRDYVSGAMENTSAIIYGDFCQKTDRELEDDHNDGIVAHETFHHWFGDLVTCESWSNLPMNESFANYSEYLWLEHKYGKDEADAHRLQDSKGYIASSKQGNPNLIRFNYADKEEMFDAVSYNKGGAILHLLRSTIGDEAFFAGLKLYLEKNAYTSVESHQLRMAFEEVTGEDLNWFFNQWFYDKGHPTLDISYDGLNNNAAKEIKVTIEQTHKEDFAPLYRIPLEIDVYEGTKVTKHKVVLDQVKQTFSLPVSSAPDLVNVDAQKNLLCEKNDLRPKSMLPTLYFSGKNFSDRQEALSGLKSEQDKLPKAKEVFVAALNDKYWGLQISAIKGIKINKETDKAILDVIAGLAQKSKNGKVRAAAYERLGALGSKDYIEVAKKTIESDRSYAALAGALDYLYQVDRETANTYVSRLEKEENQSIALTIADIYTESGNISKLPYLEEQIQKYNGFPQMNLMGSYAKLAASADANTIKATINKMLGWATSPEKFGQFGRFGATSGLFKLGTTLAEKEDPAMKALAEEIKGHLKTIKSKEKDSMLLQYYQNFE